jgi:integrase/recombinase XerD
LVTNQNQRHLSLVIKNNGFNNIETRQRIIEATSGLSNHYFTMMAKRMSASNADLLARFIIQNRKDSILAINTIKMYIDGIVYLESFHKHKDLDKLDRNDILAFLDSYRKSETVDPLHKWVATYNIRLMIIFKFFRWLYGLNHDRLTEMTSTARIVPPIIRGIKRLKRKEKSSYQVRDLWTQEDDAIFLKYCEDNRLRCYHTMARDTSGRPHELLKIRIGDIMWQMNGTAQYAEVTIGKGGKTVQRTVPLTNSIPYLKDWLREHPIATNRNSFLFLSLNRRSRYRNIPLNPLSVAIIYRQLKLGLFPRLLTNQDISEEDKRQISEVLDKPWNPYVRRHTALTEKVKLLKSEYALRQHAGWSKNSKMVEIYTHEFGNESSQLLLQAYDIIPENTRENDILKPRQCPNCNEPNKPDSKFCAKCRMVLTYDAYNETLEKQQERDSEIQILREKQEHDMRLMREEMENRFRQILTKIDIGTLK